MASKLALWLWGPWSKLGLMVAAASLVADQLNKWCLIFVYGISKGDRVALTPFLDLVYVINKGISYGLFALSDPRGQLFLAIFAVFAALLLVIWLARGATNWVMAVSIGLIIGGAIGNAIDRLHLGGVADFYSLHAFGYYWYVFNIADVAIVAGVIGLLYDCFWMSRKDAAKAP